MYIDAVVHPLQAESTASHNDSTTREETNSASSAQHVKNRVGIPSVVLITLLDPEPVRNGNATTNAQSR